MSVRIAKAWTENDVALLRTMWDQGRSASEISRELGGKFSRNAVLGKVFRLGLPPHITGGPSGQSRGARKTNRPKRPVPRLAAAEPLPFVPLGATDPLTLLTVGRGQCRWILGDGPLAPICGHPAMDGRPYCEHHCARSWRRAQDSEAAA